MKKLASLLTINGLVPTYANNLLIAQSLKIRFSEQASFEAFHFGFFPKVT